MRVVGTAGHVDHGKSTLIQAITGINPDRLSEEKERGMTIDLGFAWLNLPSGESIGVVDVPGHIDFIKNMLAGVGGIDAALLVVAADEGVMPQTQEHLAILDLLEVSSGVVAITKADLAEDEDWLELVQADVAETLDGTVLANAPIIPVSAVTGLGVDELLQALDSLLQQTPPRADKGRPRLLVDRVFTVSGFGTVVTGTLIDGQLMVGQEVEILPKGLRSRIRGLQSHKQKVDQASPGSRVAINLTNVSTDDVKRGDVVTLPDWLVPSQLIDSRVRVLADAPRALKHNQQVEIFTGSAEVPGYLRLLGTREIGPGQEGWVQLRLKRRIPVVKGDHFIIRQASPSLTIGGGFVVDPLPRRRHRRFRPDLISRLQTLADGTPEDLLIEMLDRTGPQQIREVLQQAVIPAANIESILQHLLKAERIFTIPRSEKPPTLANAQNSREIITSRVGWSSLVGRLTGELATYHQTNPLRMGMARGELKSRLNLETGLFNKAVDQIKQEGVLEASDTMLWLAEHKPQFSAQQQRSMEILLDQFKRNPFATPSAKDSLAKLDNNEDLLRAMLESGQLVRASPEVLFLPDTYATFTQWLQDFVTEHGSVTVGQVRDAFNTSRKYALAMLEHADANGLTRRVGDERILR